MAISGNRLKPSEWTFSPLLVARQYQDLWRGCQLFVPFWSPKTTGTTEFLAGSIIQDIGPHKVRMTAAGSFSSGNTIAQIIATKLGLAYRETTFFGNEGFNSDTRLTNVMASTDATVAVLGEWGTSVFFATRSDNSADGDILTTGTGNVITAQNKFTNQSISGTTNIGDGLPHLCLYEYDTSTQVRTIYVDGKQEASGSLGRVLNWAAPSIMGATSGGIGAASNTNAYYFIIWNRKLSSIEKALLTADPFGMIRPAFQPIDFGQAATGLNVAITGAAATASAGAVSLAITSNVSVSGAAATSGAGAPSKTVSVVSPGTSATSGAGTATGSVSIVSPGASATSAAGTPSHEIDVVSPGAAANSAAGTVSFSGALNVPVTGTSATASSGTVTPSLAITAAGAGTNTTAGTVTASLSVPVIGTPATASSGIVLASEGAQPLGAGTAASSGTVVPSVAITEIGAAANSAAGAVSSTSGLNVPVTGASAASASGTVSLGITSNLSLVGASALTSAGILQALGISSSILVPGVVPGQPASGATLVAGVVPGQPASGGTVAPGVVPGQPASGATLVAGVAG